MPVDTIIDRLQRHARERPDAPPSRRPDRVVTYRELHALAGGCAAWLRSLDIENGERVGLSIVDDLTHCTVMLGLATPRRRARHAGNPRAGARALATRGTGRRTARHRGRCGARAFRTGARVGRRQDALVVALRRLRPLAAPDPSAEFTFFTTSGTTGQAKIIPILHGRYIEQTPAGTAPGYGLSLSPLEHHFVKRAVPVLDPRRARPR
jgi:acyl-CoA synthetase (AMP-forming)/AMP-acid ligase II